MLREISAKARAKYTSGRRVNNGSGSGRCVWVVDPPLGLRRIGDEITTTIAQIIPRAAIEVGSPAPITK